MKRLLISLLALPAILSACGSPSICTQNDNNCDGVPDDLGRAVNRDGEPGADPWDADGDGEVDGLAVDIDCDGSPDALGIDTNGDNFVDSIDLRDGTPTIATGSSRAVYDTCSGSSAGVGGTPVSGDGDMVTPTPGTGGTPAGTGGAPNPWTDIPELDPGPWFAPVVPAAKTALAMEYTRWRSSHVKDCGGGKTTVKKATGGGAVSEGIGYGMLITASLGSKAEFDAMWEMYKTAGKAEGNLMPWNCPNECGPCTDNAASDADLDVAMALLQAEVNFDGGSVYSEAAKQVIGSIRGSVLKSCGPGLVIVAGPWDPNCNNLNPSYYSPGYYRAFAQVDPLGATQWLDAVDNAYTLLDQSKSQGGKGLWPDGTGDSCFACNGYDAARVPWRIATDYAWTGDTRAIALMAHVQGKVDSTGMPGLATDPNSAFYGAFATTGLSGGQAKADAYYNTWITANPLQDSAYYQATLRVIYHMLMAGQFPSTLAL